MGDIPSDGWNGRAVRNEEDPPAGNVCPGRVESCASPTTTTDRRATAPFEQRGWFRRVLLAGPSTSTSTTVDHARKIKPREGR